MTKKGRRGVGERLGMTGCGGEVGNDEVWERGWEWGGRGPYPVTLFWGKYPPLSASLDHTTYNRFLAPMGQRSFFFK